MAIIFRGNENSIQVQYFQQVRRDEQVLGKIVAMSFWLLVRHNFCAIALIK